MSTDKHHVSSAAMPNALQNIVSFANHNCRAFGGVVAEAENEPFLF
jgi:hypothetical protein